MINCFTKRVTFQRPKLSGVVFESKRWILPLCIISVVQASKLVHKGCQTFLSHIIDTTILELRLKEISIVSGFSNVFLGELPGLPLDQTFDFVIELVLGTTKISIPHYRMASN